MVMQNCNVFGDGSASYGNRSNTSWGKDFIVKPFQPDRVVEAVKKVLS